MADHAQLIVGETTIELPMVIGSEQERGLDIKKLRTESGLVTLDNGFISTASCRSGVTFLNGEKGYLRYRGYPIEQLAKHSNFVETALLLLYGELPSSSEFAEFGELLIDHSVLHNDILGLIDAFPANAHPMAALAGTINALSAVYPSKPANEDAERLLFARMMASFAAIAAAYYRNNVGLPRVHATRGNSYTGNFLRMMFARPTEAFEIDQAIEDALDLLLVLHADHEQNCSASTVRLVGSSQAGLFASISAGINALSGPLHGGANQKVIEMLETIYADGSDYEKYVALAKDKDSSFRLMGFGHRVYKNFDPRAKIIKGACEQVLQSLGVQDPLLDIAKNLEQVALEDDYFVRRRLYPNVDFYSGIIYRALGIPTNMFTVMFAIGRLPGWMSQWREMMNDSNARIGRPRQIYIGANKRDYIGFDERR